MAHSKKQIHERMHQLLDTMLTGGKVVVKDKFDHTIKESSICSIYADNTVTLPDTVNTEYNIFEVTIIKN